MKSIFLKAGLQGLVLGVFFGGLFVGSHAHAQRNPFLGGNTSVLQNSDVFYNYVGDVRCKTRQETDRNGNISTKYYDCESTTSSLVNNEQLKTPNSTDPNSSVLGGYKDDASATCEDVIQRDRKGNIVGTTRICKDRKGTQSALESLDSVEGYKGGVGTSALDVTEALTISDTLLNQTTNGASNLTEKLTKTCPSSFSNLTELTTYLICFVSNGLIPLILTVAVLMFFYGILRFLAAGENADSRSQGKWYLLWGLVGIFVMVSLWGIIGLFTGTLLGGAPMVPQLQQSYKK